MPGMCFATTRWLDRLWSEHLEASEPARDLVQAGIKKQGEVFAGFPADLHARLYLPRDPAKVEDSPGWATKLHDLASELAEWARLRAMCARNGFAAGIATETMLEQLLPHVPDRPEEQEQQQHGQGQGQGQGQEHGQGQDQGQDQGQNQDQNQGQGQDQGQDQGQEQGQASKPVTDENVDAALRAAIRKASRAARDAVQEAESGIEALAGPMGFSMPGTAVVKSPGPADLKAIREAHVLLKNNSRLKQICELAGRMERVAASKARSRVKPGVGEVHGIEPGGLEDLARVLPGELGLLKKPRLRTLLLARLLQRQALTYAMSGREPQSRGPVVVLLDESSSMRNSGKDVWSKAVALALLGTATSQKRAWHLVGFNGAITREVSVPVGTAKLLDIIQALDNGCAGGTNFNEPVRRAVELIRSEAVMRQADVVIITDGQSSIDTGTVEAVQELNRAEGVSWYVLAIGADAGESCSRVFGDIAAAVTRVLDTGDVEVVGGVVGLDSR